MPLQFENNQNEKSIWNRPCKRMKSSAMFLSLVRSLLAWSSNLALNRVIQTHKHHVCVEWPNEVVNTAFRWFDQFDLEFTKFCPRVTPCLAKSKASNIRPFKLRMKWLPYNRANGQNTYIQPPSSLLLSHFHNDSESYNLQNPIRNIDCNQFNHKQHFYMPFCFLAFFSCSKIILSKHTQWIENE